MSTSSDLQQENHPDPLSDTRCYCQRCERDEDDEWIGKYTPEEAVDSALQEFHSVVERLVQAEMELEHVRMVYRQTNFRILRLSRRLRKEKNVEEYERLRGEFAGLARRVE